MFEFGDFFHYSFVLFAFIPSLVTSICSFHPGLQGVYVTQSTVSRGSEINYLEVSILPDSIPVWGECHRRIGNNVILYDMAGSMECLRCFHIRARSVHIVEIHTGALDTCYTNERAAMQRCPTEEEINDRKIREIMLYKKKPLVDLHPFPPVYCPFNGKFRFTYDQNDGTEAATECPGFQSTLSNCPRGNQLTLSFRGCTFSDFEKTMECLGTWQGSNGQRFLALQDPSVDDDRPSQRGSGPPAPKYRCALFKEEANSIFLSFSSDSTCFNNLHSAYEGFEKIALKKESEKPLPREVDGVTCSFPPWSQGEWEDLRVSGSSMTFTDLVDFKSYEMRCLAAPIGGLVPVFVKDHCGDEMFTCMAVQERSSNVMEFQISESGSSTFSSNLCERPYSMRWPAWITQGRVDRFIESPCPVAGEYTGIIPDAPSLCAKLSSDCNNPEIMFYTVSSCRNLSEIYEEREYRCLGQWIERGITYTYTERRDINSYECFSGVVMNIDEIFIAEAGINCKRGLHPASSGMRLQKQAACETEGVSNILSGKVKEVEPPWWGEFDGRNTIEDSTSNRTNPVYEVSHQPASSAQSYSGVCLSLPLVLLGILLAR